MFVPDADTCSLHPEGHADPAEAIPVIVEEDGVARFLALRPTAPGAVDRLALDCVDRSGSAKTYPVDLRSEETFAPRPFDASRTTLEARPALPGDPLSYTQAELLARGYGLRPDPGTNPGGYARWLRTATIPVHKLRSVTRAALRRPASRAIAPIVDAGTVTVTSLQPWTGAVLTGSYQVNVGNPSLTESYAYNEVTFNVPTVTPGGYSSSTKAITIWNGLDNVFQAIVDVVSTPTVASFGIHRQNFEPHGTTAAQSDTAATTFTPKPGDTIYDVEWYCDANGNVAMSGGYACSYMEDVTQGLLWECDRANSTACASYQLNAGDETNGSLGYWADLVVENDSIQYGPTNDWPQVSPITMSGSAEVVQGNSQYVQWVTTTTDPAVSLGTDWAIDAGSHATVALSGGESVSWTVAGSVAFGPISGPGDWNTSSDWNYGYYKGTCSVGWAQLGLSAHTDGSGDPGYAHAILCRNVDPVEFPATYVGAPLVLPPTPNTSPCDSKLARNVNGSSDWAGGYCKLECDNNQYVAGSSEDTANRFHGIRCGVSARSLGNVCNVRVFDRTDSVGATDHGDWDPQFHKGECAANEYLAGVSVDPQTYNPHSLLCCTR